MPFSTLEELRDTLLRLQLATHEQIDECVTRLSPTSDQASDLLRVMLHLHYLTPYQFGRLEKGQTEGLVLGNYKLVYKNASGSYARVFRASSLDNGEMVGLKILRDRWAGDPAAVAQFRREAELGKKLRHKNIVPIYDVASQGDYHYFTMEFVEGGNLKQFINARKKLSPPQATHCILDMCEGLDYAIGKGVTHRDLKLTNVLMSARGVAKLVDFGLAGDSAKLASHSELDGVQRALEYAALEKGTNAPSNDPRSDLFFVGAIFYELLTGEPPYPRTSSREERRQLSRYQNIRSLRSVDPNIPRSVLEIVERLMLVDPGQRYQRASDVISDCYAALAEMGENEQQQMRPAMNGLDESPSDRALPTVMCIENRIKQQDLLREYLSRRGFRVLVLNDFQRGLGRIETHPPDCVLLMGEAIGNDIVTAYEQATAVGTSRSVVVIAVLGADQAELEEKLQQSETARVLVQPITLRDLRREVRLALQERPRTGRE